MLHISVRAIAAELWTQLVLFWSKSVNASFVNKKNFRLAV